MKQVAALLYQKDILTGDRWAEIVQAGNGAGVLVSDVLLGVEITPVELFAEFVYALKQYGNKPFKTFVSESIENQRKNFYRELFKVEAGPGRLDIDSAVMGTASWPNNTVGVVSFPGSPAVVNTL